ncbi:MAG: sulfatase-like hydrolase/transferase, partial [Candidatus Cryptobacteroides sp.]
QRDKDAPFFLALPYNPPHSPYESTDDCMEEDYNIYKDMTYRQLYVRENADTTLSKAPSARYYFANVTGVDREFGRILSELKKLGLDKNTIVVFTSDHGETMCSQGILDPKNSIYTESFNVPMIIRYPGKIRPHVDTTLLSSVDIMPTLLSMAGLHDNIPQSAEGQDLSSILMEKENACQAPSAVLYIRNVNGEVAPDGKVSGFFPVARGIRTSTHTMEISIKRDGSLGRITIFDDKADPYQMHPIDPEANPQLFATLTDILREKLREANDIWYRDNIIEKILK